MAVIERVSEFIKSPKLSREEAGRLYQEGGGILKADGDRLIFPDKNGLITQLEDAMVKRYNLTTQLRFWNRQYRGLASDNVLEDALRLADPLFWEHLLRLNMERDYRTSFEKVELPMKYMREEKYRRIIHTFIRDKEYRKRLVKAKTSKIGQKSTSIKENAEKGKEFRRKIVREKLEKLKEGRAEISRKILVLEALLGWSLSNQVE
jgi:hypothetical protein